MEFWWGEAIICFIAAGLYLLDTGVNITLPIFVGMGIVCIINGIFSGPCK